MTYIMRELQNAQSHRNGEVLTASSLTAAKREASRRQMFKGTVIAIDDEEGRRLSVKEGKTWTDQ